MTVTTTDRKIAYTGDGVTTTYPFSFPITDETELVVQFKDSDGLFVTKVLTTDYTVNGINNTVGQTNYKSGNVVMGPGDIPTATDELIISRQVSPTQGTVYKANGVFPAIAHETALDKLTMITQQLDEELSRAIKLDIAITGVSTTLPDPAADQYLKYNSAGDALETFTLSSAAGLGNLVEDTSPELGADLSNNGFNVRFSDNKGIHDDNDNQMLLFDRVASAVNYVSLTNAATGSEPTWNALGDDTNVGMRFQAKGTGAYDFLGTASQGACVRLFEDTDNGSNYMGLCAPAAITSSVELILPDGAGTSGHVLTTDGTDTLSWSALAVSALANGTDGELITWDAAGAPTTVAAGTSGHVLTSNGAGAEPTFQAASNTGLTLLATATASSDASVDFTSNIDSTYDDYIIELTNVVPATDDVALYVRASVSSSFLSGASDYSYRRFSSATNVSDTADSMIQTGNAGGTAGISNVAAEAGVSGYVYLRGPASTTHHKRIDGQLGLTQANLESNYAMFAGRAITTSAVDGIQFLFSSGNIATGEFKLYGISKS